MAAASIKIDILLVLKTLACMFGEELFDTYLLEKSAQ